MIKYFFRCCGIIYLPVSICPVIIGASCANYHGEFEGLRTSMCLLFAIFAQMTANLFHRYTDIRNGRPGNESDPDVAMLDKEIDNRQFLYAATWACLIVSAILGLTLMAQSTIWSLLIGMGIFATIYFYNEGPHPLHRIGFSEILAFIFFGPVPVIGTTYINMVNGMGTQIFHMGEFMEIIGLSIISGLCAVSVLTAHYLWTMDSDRIEGKRNIVTTTGRRAASWVFLLTGVVICVAYRIMLTHSNIEGGRDVPEWTIVTPCIYLAFQAVIFILMRRWPKSKYYMLERLSMLNFLILTLSLAVYCEIYGLRPIFIGRFI